MSFWPSDTAGKIADVLSGVSLIVTIILANGAWQVKKRLERADLYPKHVETLERHADRISEFLVSTDLGRIPELNKETGSLQGSLNALHPLVSGQTRKSVQSVLDVLEAYNNTQDEAHLFRLSNAVYRLHAEMDFLLKGLNYLP